MRPTLSYFAAALGIGLGSLGHAGAAEPARPLGGEELQTLLVGNTLVSVDDDGPYWIYYPTAAILWGRSASGDVDVGHWWIEDGRYCRAWRRWFQGRTRCWRMGSEGANAIVWYSPEGVQEGRSTLRRGNAMGELSHVEAAPSQLADASTGLSSVVESIVERGAVTPEDPMAARRSRPGELKRVEDREAKLGPPIPPPSPQPRPPLAPENLSPSPATTASGPAATGGRLGQLAGSRLGAVLDRLGVRTGMSKSSNANESSGSDRGAHSGKEGSDRDRD